MAILYSCCCWHNVRKGSLASGIYTLILCLVTGGMVGYHLALLRDRNVGSPEERDLVETMHSTTQGWLVSTLVVCVLLFITSVLLIIGIHKDVKSLLVPWVCVTLLMIVVDTAVLIFQCVSLDLLSINIIQMVIWLGLTVLNIYCVMCVISQYQELKAGRGTLEYFQEQRARIIYQPGIQQIHISPGPIVMACPGTMTSYTQVQRDHDQGSSSVMTTVMMSPPGYDVATQLPSYSSGEGAEAEFGKSTAEQKSVGAPPPYQP